MAKKYKQNTDFTSERTVLNYRPKITYIEPDQIDEDLSIDVSPEVADSEESTIDSVKQESIDLIEEYKQIEVLSDLAQERIDARSKDLIIELDKEQDAHILDALQRHFGDPNKTSITYNDYKQCLTEIHELSEANFLEVNPKDIENGASDPFKNTFGSMGMKPGLGRPELEKQLQPIKPLDMAAFQSNGILTLFELLKPLLGEFVIKKVKDLLP